MGKPFSEMTEAELTASRAYHESRLPLPHVTETGRALLSNAIKVIDRELLKFQNDETPV